LLEPVESPDDVLLELGSEELAPCGIEEPALIALLLSIDTGSEEALGIEVDGIEELCSSELELDGIEELTTGLELDSDNEAEDSSLELELLATEDVVELVALDDGVLEASEELEEATAIGLST